jgi:hypothetical protein
MSTLVEHLTERDVERADALANRGRQRALDADEVLSISLDGALGQPVVELSLRLLAGEHLVPDDLAFAPVRLLDGGVEDALGGSPDVGAGAVALDERNDGSLGHDEGAGVGHADDFAVRRGREVRHGRDGYPSGPRAASAAATATLTSLDLSCFAEFAPRWMSRASALAVV